MGLVELINLQAGEMGQLVLHKLFGWVSPVDAPGGNKLVRHKLSAST